MARKHRTVCCVDPDPADEPAPAFLAVCLGLAYLALAAILVMGIGN